MQQLVEQHILNVISYILQFRHLLCNPCQSVMLYTALYYHLYYYYKIHMSICKVIVS
jgi:hypothetical protein